MNLQSLTAREGGFIVEWESIDGGPWRRSTNKFAWLRFVCRTSVNGPWMEVADFDTHIIWYFLSWQQVGETESNDRRFISKYSLAKMETKLKKEEWSRLSVICSLVPSTQIARHQTPTKMLACYLQPWPVLIGILNAKCRALGIKFEYTGWFKVAVHRDCDGVQRLGWYSVAKSDTIPSSIKIDFRLQSKCRLFKFGRQPPSAHGRDEMPVGSV